MLEAIQARGSKLEDQRDEYLKQCHLTKENFFCEAGDTVDNTLQFVTENGFVIPCCRPSPQTELSAIDERQQLFGRVHRLQERLRKFYELMYQAYHDDTSKILFDPGELTTLEAKERSLRSNIEHITADITICNESIFSPGMLAVQTLPNRICEPMNKILDSMELGFYPGLLDIEQLIANARIRAHEKIVEQQFTSRAKQWLNWFYESTQNVLKRLASAARRVYDIASWAIAILLTNGLSLVRAVFRRLKNYAVATAVTLCAMSTDEKRLLYYAYLHEFILYNLTLAKNDVTEQGARRKFYAVVKNSIAALQGPRQLSWVLYLCQSTKDMLIDLIQDVKQTKGVLSLKDIANIRTSLAWFMVQDHCNQPIQDLNEPKELAKWLWIIIVWCFDKILILTQSLCLRTIDVQSWADKLGFTKNQVKEIDGHVTSEGVKEEKLAAKSGVATEPVVTPVIATPITPSETESATNPSPPIVVSANIADAAKDLDAQIAKTSQQVENKEIDSITMLEISEAKQPTGDVYVAANELNLTGKNTEYVIAVMFKCFWYFQKHNAFPKEDFDDNLVKFKGKESQSITQSLLNTVPPFVKYAFCRGQAGNSETYCQQLANDKETTVFADSDLEKRYLAYVQKAKEERKRKEDEQKLQAAENEQRARAQQVGSLLTESQIRATIAETVEARKAQLPTQPSPVIVQPVPSVPSRQQVNPVPVRRTTVPPPIRRVQPVVRPTPVAVKPRPVAKVTPPVAKIPPVAATPPPVVSTPSLVVSTPSPVVSTPPPTVSAPPPVVAPPVAAPPIAPVAPAVVPRPSATTAIQRKPPARSTTGVVIHVPPPAIRRPAPPVRPRR